MMSVRELRELKKKYGYTNEMIAEKTGVPLSTVQKIFSGVTKHPRYDTLLELTKGLSEYNYDLATYIVREEAAEYSTEYENQFQDVMVTQEASSEDGGTAQVFGTGIGDVSYNGESEADNPNTD